MKLCLPVVLTSLTMVSLSMCRPSLAGDAQPEKVFYVSAEGRDDWSGALPEPNRDGTDGPFATLHHALQAVGRVKAASGRPVPCTVNIRAGTYYLEDPLVITPAEGGRQSAPVTWQAYRGERVIISGGRRITNWRKGPGGLWVVHLPEVREGKWYFHQLFVNGHRRPRARHPNEGYLLTAGPLPEIKNPHKHRGDPKASMGFCYRPGDIKRWPDLDEVNIFLYHSWTASLHWIKEVNEAERTVRFTAPCNWPVGWWEREQRYRVENFRDALDEPGEWYLDRKTGTLYYWPLPGEDPGRATVVAPRLQHIIEIRGDPQIGLPVEHVALRGLSFQHAAWQVPRDQRADGQAAFFLSAAVFVQGATDCTFEQCEIAHVGEYGIWFERGCKNNSLVQCHLHDLGAGGVKIGEPFSRRQQPLETHHNVVDNCFIHDGGHVFPAGVGVWIGRSSYNTVRHNEICDFYYTGVSVGWSWGYAPSSAHHNTIEWNHIHHIGMGVLSDMGGIYTLGQSQGTRLTHNLIHDIYHYKFGAGGIYPDEGSTDITIQNNICYNTSTGGFTLHYGRMNIVRNNIFAFSHGYQLVVGRPEEHISAILERNIAYCDNDKLFSPACASAKIRCDYNCYWSTSAGRDMDFAGFDLDEWLELGRDKHSILADPRFVAADRYDFRLRPDSPALKLGFKPLDLSGAGLYGDREWVELARAAVHRTYTPPPPPPPPLTAFHDDFEDSPVGGPPKLAKLGAIPEPARIEVTDETAASGKHSLKFVDAAGLEHTWQPHLHYDPRIRRGAVRLSFDVRMEEHAVLVHEWRDWRGSPYRVGPSLHLVAGGDFKANGKVVATVPVGQWFRIEILCPVGRRTDHTYTLTITLPNQTRKTFRDLSVGSPRFRVLTWVGFVSDATVPTRFYVDNVRLEVE